MTLSAGSLFDVKKKTVVLTGASGYLGKTFAETFLENGARVIVLGRSEKLDSHLAQWKLTFGPDLVDGYRFDMGDAETLTNTMDQIVAKENRIDVLVNNAHELGPLTGFNTESGSLENCTIEQWTRNIAGGVLWPFITTQKLGPVMKRQNSGWLRALSNSLRAAVTGFASTLAREVAKDGITVNTILPGYTNTERVAALNEANASREGVSAAEIRARVEAEIPLGRFAEPEEFAAVTTENFFRLFGKASRPASAI